MEILIIKYFLRSFSSLPLNHSWRVVVSYKRKYVHELLVICLFKLAQEKSVVRWTDRPAMTIAVDLGRKATKQTKTYNGGWGNFAQIWEWIRSLSCAWYVGIVRVAASYGRHPNVKYHRDTYQDDNHSLIMYKCILNSNCRCSFNLKAPFLRIWLIWLCHSQNINKRLKEGTLCLLRDRFFRMFLLRLQNDKTI